jgi:hypothetical protein
MSQYLFCGGPWHGTMREVEDARGFVEFDGPKGDSGFEEDGPDSLTYTKRGVYLDFDDARRVVNVYIYDAEGMQMRRVFDAIIRTFFHAGKPVTLPPADPFAVVLPPGLLRHTPFDGPPGSHRAN